MKKTIEKTIKTTFLNLLETNDIESIDVKLICDTLGIKRQSFYYHYKNIYDVICALYADDELEVGESDSLEVIIKTLINYLYKNEDFNKDVLNSGAKDILEEYTFSYLYRAFNIYLEKYDLRIDSKKDISRFFSKAIAEQLLYYFAHGDYDKEEIYKKLSYLVNDKNLEFLIENYRNGN